MAARRHAPVRVSGRLRRPLRLFWGGLGAVLLLWAIPQGGRIGQENGEPEDAWAAYCPPGEHRPLTVRVCSSCHSLRQTVHLRRDRSQWERTVFDMILRGAQILPEEIEPITAYLTQAFGPEVPPLVNVNRAGPEELSQIPTFGPEQVEKILEFRRGNGVLQGLEDLARLLGHGREELQKIRYYVKFRESSGPSDPEP